MKFLRTIVLGIGLVLLLAACGSAATVPPPAPSTNIPQSPPATATPTKVAMQLTDTPAPTETPVQAKRVIRQDIPAPALAENLLGDPTEQEIAVYLPPSYYTSDKRYPVVYYLAGYDEGLDDIYILMSVIDKLVEAGSTNEMMTVVISGRNMLGGSFYVNSPVSGNWEDFVITDVVNYIDQNYRTIANVNARGLAGFSMGGFGSLNLAMRHPDCFSAVYALGPGLIVPDGLATTQIFANPSEIEAVLALQAELASLSVEDAQAMFIDKAAHGLSSNLRFIIGYGIAFAPNPDKAPFIQYPYQNVDAQPVSELWQQWENGYGGIDAKIEAYQESPTKLRGILIEYGTRDRYQWIQAGSEYLARQLEAENIPHELVTFEGGHGELQSQAEAVMVPFFSKLLTTEPAKP
ncbi:MAG: hypothetical protein KDJ65_24195 [Anaerolineae bacterium]|nr:hypothetical protein [Anaerolineae bacterium]